MASRFTATVTFQLNLLKSRICNSDKEDDGDGDDYGDDDNEYLLNTCYIHNPTPYLLQTNCVVLGQSLPVFPIVAVTKVLVTKD